MSKKKKNNKNQCKIRGQVHLTQTHTLFNPGSQKEREKKGKKEQKRKITRTYANKGRVHTISFGCYSFVYLALVEGS